MGRSPRQDNPTERANARVLAFSVCAVLVLGAVTCSAAPKPKPNEGEPVDRPIRPSDREERAQFEAALEALNAGRWQEAKESFQLIRAQHESDDPVADLAELYVARASLGGLIRAGVPTQSAKEQQSGGEGRRVDRQARQMLASLKADDGIDPRVRRAARMYLAFADLAAGEGETVYPQLATFPEPTLGSAVLDRDRLALWPVLIEAFHRGTRWNFALTGADALYQLLERRRAQSSEDASNESSKGASSQEAASGRGSSPVENRRAELDRSPQGDEDSARGTWVPLYEFARSRGFEAAARLEPSEREARLDADSGFVRAVVGWAFLDAKLEAESLGEKERKQVDERYREIATDLNAIGSSSRVRELSVKMATLGADEQLVVGALLPLSGGDRSIGQRAMSAMLLAMEAFHDSGPTRVTLVFEDSTGNPATAMQRLVEAGASAVVGPLDGGRAEAFAATAKRHQVPMLTLTAVGPKRTEGGNPYVLRNFMDPVTEARAVANLSFHQYGDRRAVVVYPNVGYGSRVTQAFSEEFRQLGGQIVAAFSYDRSSSDFTETAKRVAAAEPDAVFIPDSASNVAELTAFLASQDVWGGRGGSDASSESGRRFVHYFGTSLWYDSILTRQASDYVQGAIIPAWYASQFDDDPTREFGRRFRGTHGREPKNIEAFAFDSVRWIRRLMLGRGLQAPDAILDALRGGKVYHGATGAASFDQKGRLQRKIRFISVDGQAFEPLDLQVDVGQAAGGANRDDPEAPAPRAPRQR